MKIKLDMHVHSEKSFDSVQNIDDIVRECKKKKIDGVCICDHDVTRVGLTTVDGVLILPGVETATEHGHILGYLVDDTIEPTKDTALACERIHASRGIAVLAHPYERKRDKKEHVDAFIDSALMYIDGIETLNARAPQFVSSANDYAIETAKRHTARTFGGSDAHIMSEIGNAYTEIEVNVDSIDDITSDILREALLDSSSAHITRVSAQINTAKSQYIRMKKTNAGIKRWGKYFVYAARCIILDVLRPVPVFEEEE